MNAVACIRYYHVQNSDFSPICPEKARLQAEAKAAEDAQRRAEAAAAAEARRKRELEREAARQALLKVKVPISCCRSIDSSSILVLGFSGTMFICADGKDC